MANDLNVVCLSGRLTRDPEVTYLQNGTPLTKLSMAVNRSYTPKDGSERQETSFIDCVVWGKTAEAVGQYLSKGAPCLVRGRLRLETWDDKQTGEKRSWLSVTAEEVIFGPRPAQNDGGSGQAPAGQGRPQARPPGRQSPPPPAADGNGYDSPF